MDTKNLKPGDKVIVGRRAYVEQGTQGTTALFLDRGHYTTVPTPCGVALKDYKYSTRPKIVLAVPHDRYARDSDGSTLCDARGNYVKEQVWELELREAVSVFEFHEYQMRAARVRQMMKARDKWQKEKNRQIETVNDAFKAIFIKMGVDGVEKDEIYLRSRRDRSSGKYVDSVTAPLDTFLDAIIARPYVASLVSAFRGARAALAAWEAANPDPSTCPLP